MKKVLRLLIALCIAAACSAQTKKPTVEPSEEWLNSQHQPVRLLEAIGVKEGHTVADIGAGRGRMTVFIAWKVGESGRVYANDIDKDALEYLTNRCRRENFTNVRTFVGKVDAPMLPQGEVDIAFMISTYHHLEKPVELLRNTLPCLKSDGILVIVERDPAKTGQSERESTSRETTLKQVTEAGFELVKVNTTLLARDNIYFFRAQKSRKN